VYKAIVAVLLVFLLLKAHFFLLAEPCTFNMGMLGLPTPPRTPIPSLNSEYESVTGQHSIFLPFIHPFGQHGVPLVNATVAGVPLTLPVDTGSTGLLIGAPLLPHIPRDIGTPVHHYFTSSNILYLARLVELDIVFHGRVGNADGSATTRVPVLVVDESFVCQWYRPGIDGGKCPVKDGKQAKRRDVSGIMYMGVGFGRNSPHDGMPAAIPAHNPFLDIKSINGIPVSSSTSLSRSPSPSPPSKSSLLKSEDYDEATILHTGYTLSTHGIHLGLTPHNTFAFTWTPLKPGPSHSDDPRDWSMLEMHFCINNNPVKHKGTALIDTGISHMYLRTARGHVIPNITIPNPNPNGYAKFVRRVRDGTGICVGFPCSRGRYSGEECGKDGVLARYAFRVGDGSAHAPTYVVPNNDGKRGSAGPYVNTGRDFLWAFDVAFDAVGGRFGFRAVERGERGEEKESERERFDARL